MANEQPISQIVAFKEAIETHLQKIKDNPPPTNLPNLLENIVSGSFKI